MLTKEEEEGVIRSALLLGAWLVPDIGHQTSTPLQIKTYEEFKEHRKSTRLFFIIHPSFYTVPLEMRETVRDGRHVFMVMQHNGGPAIEFLSSVEFTEGEQRKINPGFLAHHKTFWNPKVHENQAMPPTLLQLHSELCAQVKKVARREKVGVRVYWIGRAVRQLIEAAKLHLGIVQRPPV
jgi:hypothetical protein